MLRRLRDDRGFTAIELLVSCTIGVVVILAAFQVLDIGLRTQSDASARMDSIQRGRTAMNEIGRIIRSQTCLGNATPAIQVAKTDQLQLTTSTTGEQWNSGTGLATNGYQPVQRVLLTYDSTALKLTSSTTAGSGAPPGTTFTATPVTRTVAERVRQNGTTAIFRYYALQGTPANATLELVPGTGGLSQTDRQRVVRVDVDFVVRSRDGNSSSPVSRFTGRFWTRTADPADVAAGSGCT